MNLPGTEKSPFDAYMMEALREAENASRVGEVPVGAVVVEGEGIVGRAHNQVETLHDPTAHAEMIAITQAAEYRGDWRLNGMTIFVTLEPCCMCAGAMVLARFDRVVFGAPDPRAGAAGSVTDVIKTFRGTHKVDVVKGILAGESAGMLKEFFEARRRG